MIFEWDDYIHQNQFISMKSELFLMIASLLWANEKLCWLISCRIAFSFDSIFPVQNTILRIDWPTSFCSWLKTSPEKTWSIYWSIFSSPGKPTNDWKFQISMKIWMWQSLVLKPFLILIETKTNEGEAEYFIEWLWTWDGRETEKQNNQSSFVNDSLSGMETSLYVYQIRRVKASE